MHTIEPFYGWEDDYQASTDENCPFYGREYSQFEFSETIYNYYIHPKWDNFGSNTLYLKILYADYTSCFVIIELLGEWNDCINNDIMYLKREVADALMQAGINKFILIGENVLNFHASDDCYYEEWKEDITESKGWIALLNPREHILTEMNSIRLGNYINYDGQLSDLNWRTYKPQHIYELVEKLIQKPRLITH